jgi:hypothetical protein
MLTATLALLPSCRQTRCEDLVAEPIVGSYRGGGSLGEQRLLKVSLDASEKEVVLSYTTRDGSRIHAKYRVLKKTKVR